MSGDPEIIQELRIPIPSFRLFALERAIQSGHTEELLSALEESRAVERDEECRLLLKHALAAVNNRLHPAAQNLSLTAVKNLPLEKRFPALHAPDRIHFLNGLAPDEKKCLAGPAEEWLDAEKDPAVGTLLIRNFADLWGRNAEGILKKVLFAASKSIRSAALEALIRMAPESLAEYLPRLLTSDDPRIQTLGIRGLAEIDLEEALSYLEYLLTELDRPEKMAALKISVHLPFDRIKKILLKFLATEEDPELLKMAGMLLQYNPDPELPYRIWEIAESSPPPKSALLEKVVVKAAEILRESGILKNGGSEFTSRLTSLIQNRKANRFVQEFLESINPEDTALAPEVEQRVVMALQQFYFLQAFEKALSWPMTANKKNIMKQILALRIAKPKKMDSLFQLADLELLASPEICRRLAAWPEKEGERVKPILVQLLEDPGTDEEVKATCLRTALRFEWNRFVDLSGSWLDDQNPGLVGAAIEYSGRFAPQAVFSRIVRFLRSADVRIKTAAFRILVQKSPAKALEALKALLKHSSPEQRKLAFSLMIQLDFVLVRETLGKFLETNDDPELFQMGLCFFQANQDLENLFILYLLEKTMKHPESSVVQNLRISLQDQYRQEGLIDAEAAKEMEMRLAERLRQARVKAAAPPAPYALSKVRSAGKSGSRGAVLELLGQLCEGQSFHETIDPSPPDADSPGE